MSSPFSSREEEIFSRAAELRATERAAFLEEACAGDAALRARVEALLRAHDDARSFMESPPVPSLAEKVTHAAPTATAEAKVGDRIGRYKLLQKIGEGGCGVVYMAEQQEPVVRRVALKVIKLGMDTKEVVARFEAERQALALMDHPNIARVLDAGATDAGRPFFVMELVRGVPITKFCDEQNLATRARLELFTQVCHAVQHAHQKGIIHRDLKPSNILVTLHDGKPVPKVIDFGIAKATAGRLTDNTLFTAFEQFIGTPAYMSPEQAEMSGLDIDTRSDIYSLGVLLYELLTGRPPFDPKTLVAAGFDEIRRIIREVDPPRMSTRLSTLTDLDRATIAKQRGLAPAQLSTLLRGDLDWIVMRCIEKDRTRRYETANSLALDVLRHLHDEAVLARPPSAGYRVRKFARRHRVAFAATTVVTATVVIGAGLATWQAIRATRAEKHAEAQRDAAQLARKEETKARELAEQRRAEAEKARAAEVAARELAERRREEVDAINRLILSDALTSIATKSNRDDPAFKAALQGRELTLREVLDNAAERIPNAFADNPLLETGIRATIGETYLKLALYGRATPHLEAAYESRRRLLGEEHAETLASLRSLAAIRVEERKFDEAERMLKHVLAVEERVLGDDNPDTLETRLKLFETKFMRLQSPRPREEREPLSVELEALARSSWEKSSRRWGLDDPRTLKHLQKLHYALMIGATVASAGRTEKDHEAEALGSRLLAALRRVLGDSHPDTLEALSAYCASLANIGKDAEALRVRTESIAALERILGPDHESTAVAVRHRAMTHLRDGRIEEACEDFRRFASSVPKIWGWDSAPTRSFLHEFGSVVVGNGQAEMAEAFVLERLSEARRFGSNNLGLDALNYILGVALLAQNRAVEAEPLLRACLEFAQKLMPVSWSPEVVLGGALLAQKKYSEAEPLLLKGFEDMRELRAKGKSFWLFDPNLWDSHARIVRLYTEWNRPEKVAEWKKKEAELTGRRTFRTPRIGILGQKTPVNLALTGSQLAIRASMPVPGWGKYRPNNTACEVAWESGNQDISPCVRITSTTQEEIDYDGLYQSFSSENYRGHRVRFSAELKTDGVRGAAMFALRLYRDDGATIAVSTRVARGASDWTGQSIVFDVPSTQGSVRLSFGISGPGTMWVRNLKFEEVGNDVVPDNTLQGIRTSGPATLPTPISEAVLRRKAPINLAFSPADPNRASNLVISETPSGWTGPASGVRDCEISLDPTERRTQPFSLHVKSMETDAQRGIIITQRFSAENYRGQRIRFSAWVKTRELQKLAQLLVRVDSAYGRTLALDNMFDRAPTGTSEWSQYSAVVNVPVEGAAIAISCMVHGTGEVWFADARFEIVGREAPVSASGPP